MRLFSSTGRRNRQAAAELYAACSRAARQPTLFMTFGVPDTVQGRFEMLTLHLFPVLHRLMHDPGDDPELARCVSEAFVADMDAAMRELGVGDVTVPKRMKRLYGSFAARISAYKAGLEAGPPALEAALAGNALAESSHDGKVGSLAIYLLTAVARCRDAPIEALRRGEVPFPPPLAGEESKA